MIKKFQALQCIIAHIEKCFVCAGKRQVKPDIPEVKDNVQDWNKQTCFKFQTNFQCHVSCFTGMLPCFDPVPWQG